MQAEMIPGKPGVRCRFGPTTRILELAQPKPSRSVWATTPCETLRWGNQEPIRPVSMSALRAVPSARIQDLAQHKGAFSAWEDHRRKLEMEEETSFRKTQRASSKTSQYESIVRLSTPKARSSSQEAGVCPSWHIHPGLTIAVVTPRLLRLSSPKRNHPDFQSNRQSVVSFVSAASRRARVSQRLVELSLPKVKESNSCYELGRPDESITTVSRAARGATASPRVEQLAQPKQLPKDYIPPREPEWSRGRIQSA